LGADAFADTSVANITFGSNVRNIGDWAFSDCPLPSVTIPSSITNLGQYAFQYCYNLTNAYFQGNAPAVDGVAGSADGTVFGGETGMAYYLPGTSGWTNTFGGWPTAQWLPKLQPSAYTSSGTNRFGFNINWASGQTAVVEASTNLHNWTPVSTNPLVNGTNYFNDSKWTNYPKRFYRVRSQ
jgi:hypothetical protein